MKTLNPNTKKAKAFIEAYRESKVHDLHQVYKHFSESKFKAYRECYFKYCFNKGKNLRIISWNAFQFTCAWEVEKNLRVETKENSYLIPNAL